MRLTIFGSCLNARFVSIFFFILLDNIMCHLQLHYCLSRPTDHCFYFSLFFLVWTTTNCNYSQGLMSFEWENSHFTMEFCGFSLHHYCNSSANFFIHLIRAFVLHTDSKTINNNNNAFWRFNRKKCQPNR